MTRVIEFIISMLIVIALFVVIALFLPDRRTVVHSVETNRPMTTVNDLLGGFARFKDWNLLVRYDPRMEITVSGPEVGVGAKLEYRSNLKSVGSGSWEIIEFVPEEKIVFKVENNARGTNKTMTFRFAKTGQKKKNVKISQRYKVDYGWDLIGRYAGMYVTRNVGDDVKSGLDKLANLLTTIPKLDYGNHDGEFAFVDLPAVNALVATTAAKRSNEDIALQLTNQMKWIEQVMEKNALESAGPMRVVTNEFTADAYGFDVVMPVRSKGAGPAPTGEGEVAAVDPSAPLETLNVTIDQSNSNPVQFVQLPAIRAATTTYIESATGLPMARDWLKAWAMVHGGELTDRPYEEYLVSIPNMASSDAKFQVYWPVKSAATAAPAEAAPLEAAPAEAAPAEAAPAEAAEAPAAEAEAPVTP